MSLRILYIEDDKVDQMAFKRMLKDQGLPYSYRVAASAREGREVLETELFDVVIADYLLGDGTAMDILELGLPTPVIIVTGVGDEEIAVAALKAGACDYLIKDAERNYLKVLPLTVENAVRHHRSSQQVRLLSHALMSIGESVYIVDTKDCIVFVNAAFSKTYGYQPEEVMGQPSRLLWTADAPSRAEQQRLVFHRRKNGEVFSVLMTESSFGDDTSLTVVVVRDVTESQRAQEALQESEERYALAVQGAKDGLWDWNLKRDLLYFSPRWKAMLGYEDDELSDSPTEWFNRVHPDDLVRLQTDIASHLKGITAHFENEHRMLHRDGAYRWMLSRGLAVGDGDGTAYRMAGSQTDITHRRTAEEQLVHHAFHDALTGLPNRTMFMDRLERSLDRARRRKDYQFAVIFLDLDRFKIINDSLGHLVGDELLRGIAGRLRLALRPSDTVARLGGDEFAILLDDLRETQDARMVADRIQKALTLPVHMNGREVYTTASLGIALSSQEYEKAEDFLRDADTAMYRAKVNGRARHETFDAVMHDRAMAQMHLETDLWKALEREEFQLYYQPVVSLATGRVFGVEALLRWNHPFRGLIPPSEFIPLAEETGHIVSMGEWVIQQACRQIRAWKELGFSDLRVMVNVSARQFQHQDLPAVIGRILQEYGVHSSSIAVEITESTAMQNVDLTIEILQELKRMGIRICIDDFGTGHSSLGCLKRFPINTVKLDQSFVRGLREGSVEAAITRAIISMAHSLRLEVVAEGVENTDELDFLVRERCDGMQGYVFSRPLPADALTDLLREGRTQPLPDLPQLEKAG